MYYEKVRNYYQDLFLMFGVVSSLWALDGKYKLEAAMAFKGNFGG